MTGVLLSVVIAASLFNALLTLLMWLDLRDAKARIPTPLFSDEGVKESPLPQNLLEQGRKYRELYNNQPPVKCRIGCCDSPPFCGSTSRTETKPKPRSKAKNRGKK